MRETFFLELQTSNLDIKLICESCVCVLLYLPIHDVLTLEGVGLIQFKSATQADLVLYFSRITGRLIQSISNYTCCVVLNSHFSLQTCLKYQHNGGVI